jgi:hypothetical protein
MALTSYSQLVAEHEFEHDPVHNEVHDYQYQQLEIEHKTKKRYTNYINKQNSHLINI